MAVLRREMQAGSEKPSDGEAKFDTKDEVNAVHVLRRLVAGHRNNGLEEMSGDNGSDVIGFNRRAV